MNRVFVSVTENIDSPEWINLVENFVLSVLENQKKDGWELSVLFCDDSFIQHLNKEFREIDSPTDILSFPIRTEIGFRDLLPIAGWLPSVPTIVTRVSPYKILWAEIIFCIGLQEGKMHPLFHNNF